MNLFLSPSSPALQRRSYRHVFADQWPLFKKYDIRGAQTLFTPQFIDALSTAFARMYRSISASVVVVGFDARPLSIKLAQAIANALTKAKITVIWLGLVPTPLMAFWADSAEGHGIIATASHSAKDIAGVKWLVANQSPTPKHIVDVFTSLKPVLPRVVSHIAPHIAPHIASGPSMAKPVACESHRPASIEAKYVSQVHGIVRAMTSDIASTSAKCPKLSVVIDCLNGATGTLSCALFAQLADHMNWLKVAAILNHTPDGAFVKGSPDPTECGRLYELQHAVIEHRADVGLAFDGDGDRLMVVDDTGSVIDPDMLLYLLARAAIENNHALDDALVPTVLYDVKCSHHLHGLLSNLGARPQMTQTGSSLLRRAVQSNPDVIFAGELSGHFIFNDAVSQQHGMTAHDDAIYAGTRLLCWLAKYRRRREVSGLSALVAQLPQSVGTPDVYLPLAACGFEHRYHMSGAQTLIAKFKTLSHQLADQANLTALSDEPGSSISCRVTTFDGVRLDFACGFGIVRLSNTSASLTVRFAGNTPKDLRWIQSVFFGLMSRVDPKLAKQIAKIELMPQTVII